MPRFPAFNFPYYYPYYKNSNNYRYYSNTNSISPFSNNEKNITSIDQKDCTTKPETEEKADSNTNSRKKSCQNPPPFLAGLATDTPVFEIFGIKLYTDDILILCLLFFLYEENVKDDMLFIVLMLLLIS